jgi:hypothetical protein
MNTNERQVASAGVGVGETTVFPEVGMAIPIRRDPDFIIQPIGRYESVTPRLVPRASGQMRVNSTPNHDRGDGGEFKERSREPQGAAKSSMQRRQGHLPIPGWVLIFPNNRHVYWTEGKDGRSFCRRDRAADRQMSIRADQSENCTDYLDVCTIEYDKLAGTLVLRRTGARTGARGEGSDARDFCSPVPGRPASSSGSFSRPVVHRPVVDAH